MVEWIVATAVGTPILLALGAALYNEKRQISAMHEAGETLGMQVIHTDGRFPRLEGDIDGIAVVAHQKKDDRNNRLVVKTSPKGLPPEVSLVMAGMPDEDEQRRMEQLTPLERIESFSSFGSSNQKVLDELRAHDEALEVLWDLHTRHPHVSLEFGDVVVRLGQFTDADEFIDTLEDIVSLTRDLEQAFEEQPIRGH